MKKCCCIICVLFMLLLLISCTKTSEAVQNSKAPDAIQNPKTPEVVQNPIFPETAVDNTEDVTSSTNGYSLSTDIPVELMQKDGASFSKQDAKDLVKYLIPNAVRIMMLYCDTNQNTSYSSSIEEYGVEYFEADLLPYKTIEELKKVTESIYTYEYAQENFYIRAFEGTDGLPPMYIEHDGELYCMDVGSGYAVNWLYDTTDIIEQSTSNIKVNIHTLWFEEAAKEPTILEFIKEPDGWRLNSSVDA